MNKDSGFGIQDSGSKGSSSLNPESRILNPKVSVQFYHLTRSPLDRALPKLLEKAFGGGFRTLLVTDTEEHAEHLNQLLWIYDPGSFLPHGSVKDGYVELQPILICHSAARDSESAESPEILCSRMRGSQDDKILLAVTDGRTPPQPEAFERIIDMFDGNDPQATQSARERWAHYKNTGIPVSYMRQSESGGWEKAA